MHTRSSFTDHVKKTNFTVSLADGERDRVHALVKHFGGTISGFATSMTLDMSWLTIEQVGVVRTQIAQLADANRAKKNPAAKAA